MTSFQFRLDKMMFWMAVVAANIAVPRALFMLINRWDGYLFGLPILWIILEIAAFRAFRTLGRAKSFWAGFVICGSLTIIVLLYGGITPYFLVKAFQRACDRLLGYNAVYVSHSPQIDSWLGFLICCPAPVLAALAGGRVARHFHRDHRPLARPRSSTRQALIPYRRQAPRT